MTISNENKSSSIKSIFITELDLEDSSTGDYTDVSSTKKKSKPQKKKKVKTKSVQTENNTDTDILLQYKNTIHSINKNLKTWIFFVFAIAIVAKDNFFKGVVTFFVMLFFVYWIHLESHSVRNWFTISHHYHHENNNWFSHGIQILLEMQFGLLFPLINEFLMDNILDKWVIILLYFFYTTVHNVNYSLFHVNQTHELHHKNITTNIGPDICDILFDTKNQENIHDEDHLEDISHYIVNIIVGTIFVVLLKKMYICPITKLILDWWSYIVLTIISLIIIMSNTYLMNYYA
jgi:hypothetical protein